MKKNYVSPEIQVVKSAREGVILMHSDDWASGKEQNFEADDQLFNTDTKNIWAEEEEEE